jgi:hypothetical protein
MKGSIGRMRYGRRGLRISAGEFVAVVADDPGREMRLKAFHARVVGEERVGVPPTPPAGKGAVGGV